MKINKQVQRFFFVLLAIVMLATTMPISAFTVKAATTDFAGGSGTESDPYLIETKEHLDNVRNDLAAHYKMIADIDFTDEDFAEGGQYYNDGKLWIPIGTDSAPFRGVYDGNGHTISNLKVYVDTEEEAYAGLFGYISCTLTLNGVKNLGMLDCSVYVDSQTNDSYAGAISGYATNCTIKNCYQTGTVTSYGGYGHAGGIVGAMMAASVNQCYNTGNVIGDSSVGGIVGFTQYVTVRNSYNTKGLSGAYAGGIIGSSEFGKVEYCYSTGNNSSHYGSGFAGGIIGMNSNTTVNNSYYSANTYSGGGTSVSLSSLENQNSYSGFDFDNIWVMDETTAYPYAELRIFSEKYVKTVASLSLKSAPGKTIYKHNKEELDLAGGKIQATYINGKTELFDITPEMVSGYDKSVLGNQTITVTYGGKTVTFNVDVKEINVESISLVTAPIKQIYIQNTDELNLAGGKIEVTYENSSSEQLDLTSNIVSGFDNTVAGLQNLTVTVNGKTANFYVYVVPEDALDYGKVTDTLYWYINNGCLTVSGAGDMENYTSASDSPWYDDRASITKVVIEDGITSIGSRAFYNCTALTEVSIGNSVLTIGDYAFRGCTSLESVTIPASVIELYGSAFRVCSNLSDVIFEGNAPTLGNYVFNECSSSLAVCYYCNATGFDSSSYSSYNLSALHSYELAEETKASCTTVGLKKYDCKNCDATYTETLQKLTHNYVDNICEYCGNIRIMDSGTTGNVNWSLDAAGVLTIYGNGYMGSYSSSSSAPWYSDKDSITKVIIEDGVTSIGSSAFEGCSSLTSVTVPDSVTTIGDRTFYGCSRLTSITIPDSVTSIGFYAFYNCSSLEKVYINNIESWLSINFRIYSSNPLYYAKEGLYIDNEPIKEVIIPDSVTSIGSYAFRNCSSLTSITIPDSVTSISSSAFEGCSSLTSVTIPDSVTSIGSYAFYKCSSLPSITIPDSVTSIGKYAFEGCSSLEKVYINDIESWLKISFDSSYNNPMYNGADLYVDGELLTEAVFPDDVENIGYWYTGCTSITTANIPDSVTSIGWSAFYGCSSLTSITIPDSVTSIGNYAFYGCSSLTSITIPDSVTSIGGSAFSNCSSLTSITIPDSVTSISDYAFYGCSSLPSITIPDSVTSIGKYAFKNCSSLTSVTIPDSVTSIGNYAFEGCSSLPSITIPDSVTSIGRYAFYNCTNLEKITLPFVGGSETENHYLGYIFGASSYDNSSSYVPSSLKTVILSDNCKTIPEDAFYGCKYITSITIPDSVTSIGKYAFLNCSSLTSITIPDSVTSIGSYAFSGCSSLEKVYINNIESWLNIEFEDDHTSNPLYYAKEVLYIDNEPIKEVIIPESVTSIGKYAFKNCSSLTSITIPDSVTSIGWSAFYGCSSLTSITIPDSVTSIGYYAFYGCSSLEEITLPFVGGSATSNQYLGYIFGAGSYSSNSSYVPSSLKSVILSDSCTSIGSYAFENCSSLTSITIPDSVTSIGWSAFYGCSSLTSITIPDSVTSIGNYAFEGCSSFTTVFYKGTIEQKSQISISPYNSNLQNAAWHYEVEEMEFAGQNCIYCTECDTCFLPDGSITYATVTFKDENGNIISTEQYKYNETVTIPTMVSDETYNYILNCDKVIETTCNGNAEYTIKFIPEYINYTVVFKNYDGTVLSKNTYHYGDKVVLPDTPSKSFANTCPFIFTGWDKEVVDCVSDATYTATYEDTHIYSTNWTTDKAATCTAAGSKSKHCTRCDAKTSVTTIPKISTVKLSFTKKNYTGSAISAPTLTVKDSNGKDLVKGTDYTVTGLVKRTAVGRYKVTVTFKGNYSGTKTLYYTITPKAPSSVSVRLRTVTGGYDDVVCSWTKATGASGYAVYYKKASASTYTLLGRTTGTSMTKKDLSDGVKYTFKVVPYYTSNGTRYMSLSYRTASIYTLKKIATPTLSRSSDKVKVKWANINGESGYQISRSTSKTGTNIVSTYSTTSGTYKNVSATKGTTYYYKVRAYKVVNGTKVFGPWSDAKAFKR